ncbi:MAG: aldo/keto reductase [Xanthomonadales bacterium]|nr:aldo/keto reductase [Xanthomonadales bacterium]
MVPRRKFNQTLLVLSAVELLSNSSWAQSHHQDLLFKKIPSSGQLIPAIGMGTWITFDIDQPTNQLENPLNILKAFFKAGGQMIDSSPMYGHAQKVLGQILPQLNQSSQLFSATKVWTIGNDNGIKQMELSRKLWKIESFDLMYVHNMLDWKIHLPVLNKMKDQGQLKYTGITTPHGRRHSELITMMKNNPIDFIQVSYNMYDREIEKEILPLARDLGIAVVINRPFQTGGLFSRMGDKSLPQWAEDIQCQTWAQFFLKFIISHPSVSCAIPATSQISHMQENMFALKGKMPDQHMRHEMIKYAFNQT